MKGKNVGWYALLCVVVVLLIGTMTILVVKNRDYSPKEIYNKTFNGIVELKAYTEPSECAYGSAVCFSSEGYFITNAHNLVPESGKEDLFKSIEIRFPDTENFESVSIVTYSVEQDLAIIKYSGAHELNALKISEEYSTGDRCYAIGNAQNYGISITEGIISKKETMVQNNSKTITAIQCDINITEGNSGGALVNERGELIGITTFRTKDNYKTIVYGMSFSLPASSIVAFISEHMVVLS